MSMQNGYSAVVAETQTLGSTPLLNSGPLQTQPARVEWQELANEVDPAIAFDAFINCIERREQLVDLETAMLNQHEPVAFDELNLKKSQGLLELRRTTGAIQTLGCTASRLDFEPALARLRSKLQGNLSVLQMQMNAAAAVAAVIERTIEEHESDGTYTPEAARERKP